MNRHLLYTWECNYIKSIQKNCKRKLQRKTQRGRNDVFWWTLTIFCSYCGTLLVMFISHNQSHCSTGVCKWWPTVLMPQGNLDTSNYTYVHTYVHMHTCTHTVHTYICTYVHCTLFYVLTYVRTCEIITFRKCHRLSKHNTYVQLDTGDLTTFVSYKYCSFR